jgi:hypothetical protein
MKKKPQLNKKTLKNLKLKLKVNPLNDRKIAPMLDVVLDRSNSMSCSFIHCPS